MVTQLDTPIRYLSRKDVELACEEIDSVTLMREVFTLHGNEQTFLPDEAYLTWTNEFGESARSLNMPGYVGGSLILHLDIFFVRWKEHLFLACVQPVSVC